MIQKMAADDDITSSNNIMKLNRNLASDEDMVSGSIDRDGDYQALTKGGVGGVTLLNMTMPYNTGKGKQYKMHILLYVYAIQHWKRKTDFGTKCIYYYMHWKRKTDFGTKCIYYYMHYHNSFHITCFKYHILPITLQRLLVMMQPWQ